MRFNAYADFFAIRKREDESLTALMARIDQGMQNIHNLRPAAFSISDLDDELISMAMITSLPADYQSFRLSLLLLDQVDRSTLQEAFKNEEVNRLRDLSTSGASVSQALAASTPSRSLSPKKCTFCGRNGHLKEECFKKRDAMEQARKPRPQRRGDSAKQATTTDAAHSAESIANASHHSTPLFVSLSPPQPDTHADWNPDTGASSTMTPHRDYIHDYTPKRVPIRLANDTVIYLTGVGSVRFKPVIRGKEAEVVSFSDVCARLAQ